MTSPLVIIDVLGSEAPRVHDAAQPLLFADDLAAVRGDGIFETLMLHDDTVHNAELHERRFVKSAAMLDLPVPDRALWRAATALAITAWQEQFPEAAAQDSALRWVYSRGRESTGTPSGWITVAPMSPAVARARTEGIRVMTAHRGFTLDLSERSPWALIGAKTLSYAANMAALRYAHEHGFDDVIFISDDGAVLEGPTSSVIAVTGRTMVTPVPDAGILRGTTQAAMFTIAATRGFEVAERRLSVEDLKAADGVWLVSSVRAAARVTTLDDHHYPAPDCAAEVEAIAQEAVGH